MNWKLLFSLFLLNLLLLSYNLVDDGNNWVFLILLSNLLLYKVLNNVSTNK